MKTFKFVLLTIIIVGIVNVSLPVHGENNVTNVTEYNKAIESYKALLQNEKKFNFDNKNYCYLDEFLGNVDTYGENLIKVRFAILDIDDDNLPEIILQTSDVWNGRILFKYDSKNDTFYTDTWNYRVGSIKKDGTLFWISAPSWIYRLNFSNGSYEQRMLAHIDFDYSPDGNTYNILYYVNDRQVSEEEYSLFWAEQEQKEDVDWYDFNEANIDKLLETISVAPETGDTSVIFTFIALAATAVIFMVVKKRKVYNYV
ncbi:MAG: hypothetical protein FWD71_13825 [Oscillospiraceae bacterium]|nr:hypothetical protein [Oscillospiraceae bacterium]